MVFAGVMIVGDAQMGTDYQGEQMAGLYPSVITPAPEAPKERLRMVPRKAFKNANDVEQSRACVTPDMSPRTWGPHAAETHPLQWSLKCVAWWEYSRRAEYHWSSGGRLGPPVE